MATASPDIAGEDAQSAQPDPPQTAPASSDRPVHLYDAVSTQRDNVLRAYDTQRAAILQAVAEQREAAVAPIRAVHERPATQAAGHAGARSGDNQAAAMPLGMASLGSYRPYASAALTRQQLVAADIVTTLRIMIADEVRAQLCAILDAADQRMAAHAAAGNGNGKPAEPDTNPRA